MRNMIFVMSLSGSLVFLCYLITTFKFEKFFSYKWRYLMLKISLIFFLFPLPYFKSYLLDLLHLFADVNLNAPESLVAFDINNLIIIADNDIQSTNKMKLFCLFIMIMGSIAFIFITCKIFAYIKMRKMYSQFAHKVTSDIFSEQLSEMKIKQKVDLRFSEYCVAPFSFGIWKPIIVVPEIFVHNMRGKSNMLCLKHELIHIKNHDLFFKFVGLLVLCIHWFNPLCYWLFRELNTIAEYCCDWEVTKDLNADNKMFYYELIVDMATENNLSPKSSQFALGFKTKEAELVKRRLSEMRLPVVPKNKLLACLVSVAICLSASMVSLAYEKPIIYRVNGTEYPSLTSESELIFVPDGESSKYSEEETIVYDECFIDEHGNIYPITKASHNKSICQHTYVSGTTQNHRVNSSGGCTINFYNSRRCTKCNDVIQGTLAKQTTYKVCPH